ncbi:MAG: MFS transporter, partial [Ktedonobacterales bacterium]
MNPTTGAPDLVGKRPNLLVNRNFALLFTGLSISSIGDMVFDTTLIVWIALGLARGQSWAPLAVSGVLIAAAIPTAVVGAVAGVFVDRWDKRQTMLAMDATRAVVVALLVLATGAVPLPFVAGGALPLAWRLGAIYITVFFVNALGRFFGPASSALVGDLVREADRTRASGLQQSATNLALVIGTALAPPLYLAFGPQWALLINAASFAVSFACVRAIIAPPPARSVAAGQRGNFAGEFGAGLRFFARSRVLMTLAIALMLVMLGGGALNALDVFFATRNLHASATIYGLMDAAFGAGAIIGAIVLSTLARRVRAARMAWGGLLVLGLLIIVYSRLTSPLAAVALLFVVGIFNAAINVAVGPLMLHVTPRELRGRVSALLNPLTALASLVSLALAGVLASTLLRGLHADVLGFTFGPIDTIMFAAGVLVVLGGVYT